MMQLEPDRVRNFLKLCSVLPETRTFAAKPNGKSAATVEHSDDLAGRKVCVRIGAGGAN